MQPYLYKKNVGTLDENKKFTPFQSHKTIYYNVTSGLEPINSCEECPYNDTYYCYQNNCKFYEGRPSHVLF